PVVSFCWHGGEPLIAGLDFYKRAMELQRRYAAGKKIENTLQTNATLLNEQWAEFFAVENFLLGISIDGVQQVHDSNRLSRGAEPTFDKVMHGISLLHHAGAEFNTLSALSSVSAGRGVQTYNFLKSIGSHYMQFLPVVEHTKVVEGYSRDVICAPEDKNASLAQWSISGRDYGRFLVDVFEEWILRDVGSYYVQMFDSTLALWCGQRAGVCSMNENCGDNLVVEHNGTVYSCDHFVYLEYELGHIAQNSLRDMALSRAQFNFGAAKSSSLPAKCIACRWESLCHGECPKHRFDGGVSALCDGLQHFFRHSAPAMEFMRDAIAQGQSPSMVMSAVLEQ
ncbi:MAG: anaerobic sulfatase maturase, partial [Mucinivorans sp.]